MEAKMTSSSEASLVAKEVTWVTKILMVLATIHTFAPAKYR
jgi:hypothetical protein